MTKVCLVVPSLSPAEESPVAADIRALAGALKNAGGTVAILQTGAASAEARAPAAAAAAAMGAAYHHLDTAAPDFGLETFPAVESHRLGLRVKEALAALQPAAAVFFGRPALAAASVAARRCGQAAFAGSLVLALGPLESRRRKRRGDFPAYGREEIALDFLERQAVAGANSLVCFDPAIRSWLEGESWTLPPDVSVESPAASAESAAAWRRRLRAPPPAASAPLTSVSVCLPYHEKPGPFAEALESLAAQTAPPLEVIAVDDGSTGAESAAAWARAEARYAERGWKFLRQENRGPAAARNRAAQAARGGALIFCDADNRFRPRMVEALAHALAASGAACVTCGFQAFRDAADRADRGYRFVPLGPCLDLALLENVLGDTNFIVRREAFWRRGGFPEGNRVGTEDWEFLLGLARSEDRLETLPEVLFDYRLAPGSHARSHNELAGAEAALGPLLSEAAPPWRRLWLFLAGAVRDRRWAGLQAELETARAKLGFVRGELAHRTEALRLTRQHAANLEELRGVLEKRVRELESRCDQVARSLEAEIRRRDGVIQAREAKIRAMQASFSWRVTAPLRYLRRQWLDRPPAEPPPEEGKADGAAPSAGPDEPNAPGAGADGPRLAFSVDYPQSWSLEPRTVTLRGWCYAADGRKLTAVRAVLGDRTAAGVYGLKRLDVFTSVRRLPQAEYCGWRIELAFRLGDALLDLEAADEAGNWHRFFHTGLKIGEGLAPLDLTVYEKWIEAYDRRDPESLRRQAAQAAALPFRPLISVLVPVYNPPERWLERMFASVRAQTYPHWELCLADDASTAPHVRPLLERWAREDPRVKLVLRPENGHIAAASNSALALAAGDFVALLDHDDELAPQALHEVAALLNERPETDFIYSDEDKIDEEGRRFEPYFKPDFLPDLFLGQNYVAHLAVYRASLARAAGGFRPGYEGSQDWDLALRVVELTEPARIRHIPRVLYHWRAIPGSTALMLSEKNYPFEAAGRALADHFRRRGRSAELRPVPGDHWRTKYPLPPEPPFVSLVMPTRNGLPFLRQCLDSILEKTAYPRFEIVVVDNGSDDPEALRYLRGLEAGAGPRRSGREVSVRVLEHPGPFNYSALNNFGVRQAKGEIVGLLNNDLEAIHPDWMEEMASQALRPEIGCVGAMLYYPNDTIQHAGCVLGIGGVAGHCFLNFPRGTEGRFNRARLAQNYSAVTAACLFVRRSLYEQVGGLDEKELAVAFNDVDFCLKVRESGYWNLWTPFAELYHHESASRGADDTSEKAQRFEREIEVMLFRWGEILRGDPAYNPNLTLEANDFSLASPPRPSGRPVFAPPSPAPDRAAAETPAARS